MGWMDCEYCGDSLRGGAYTAPWEDDDNAYGTSEICNFYDYS